MNTPNKQTADLTHSLPFEARSTEHQESTQDRRDHFADRLKIRVTDAKPRFDLIHKQSGLKPFRVGNPDDLADMLNRQREGKKEFKPENVKRWYAGERVPSDAYRADLCVILRTTWVYLRFGAGRKSTDDEMLEGLQTADNAQEVSQEEPPYPANSSKLQISPNVAILPSPVKEFVINVVHDLNIRINEYAKKTPDKSRAFSEPSED